MREPNEIAADIRALDYWDYNLIFELCEAAGMLEEWKAVGPYEFEDVIFAAAEKLGVEIL